MIAYPSAREELVENEDDESADEDEERRRGKKHSMLTSELYLYNVLY